MLKDLQEIVKKNCAHDEKAKKVTNTVKELVNNVGDNVNPDEVMKLFKVTILHTY